MGSVGEGSSFKYPIKLEGGGSHRIIIGNRTKINAFTVLGCWEKYDMDNQFNPEIKIGNDCLIGEYCHISAIDKIHIGNGLLTGRFVYIGDNSHGGLSMEESFLPPQKRKLTTKGGVFIGENVWIGDKVTVLSGVSIGDNVIIGANSVVTHSIPSNSIALGTPAKVFKHLD